MKETWAIWSDFRDIENDNHIGFLKVGPKLKLKLIHFRTIIESFMLSSLN